MAPVVDRLKQGYGSKIDFLVYKDAGSDAEIAAFANDKGVQYVPTMMLVDASGKELGRWVGVTAETDLKQAFDEAATP